MQREDFQEERDRKVARFRKYFGLSMALFYFAAALLLALIPLELDLSPAMRRALVALLALYGTFRLYRSLK
jgi:uncharacterized membrane protein